MQPCYATAIPLDHLNKEMQDDVNLSLAAALAKAAATELAEMSRPVEAAINCGDNNGNGNSRTNTSTIKAQLCKLDGNRVTAQWRPVVTMMEAANWQHE